MEIIKFQDSQQFYQRVKNYLLNQEATHCLLLFLSKTLSTSQLLLVLGSLLQENFFN
jgi:hypothetical protein